MDEDGAWDSPYLIERPLENLDDEDPLDDEILGPFPQENLARKFGLNVLVQAARQPCRVRQLLSEGTAITADAMFAVSECLQLESLELLLDAGADPNGRLDAATVRRRRETKDSRRFKQ